MGTKRSLPAPDMAPSPWSRTWDDGVGSGSPCVLHNFAVPWPLHLNLGPLAPGATVMGAP